MKRRLPFALLLLAIEATLGSDFKAFDDTVLFKINWPGKDGKLLLPDGGESYQITSSNNERYICNIPDVVEREDDDEETYSGPNAAQLLQPLFERFPCSYKFEFFWTYELCPGHYLRQYHEDRDGKKAKLQEFYLGKLNKERMRRLIRSYETADKAASRRSNLPTVKIDGTDIPYVEVLMGNGSICDLTDKPRITRVLYVCHRHDGIYSITEPVSCEYEAIVATPLLCAHPNYKQQDVGVNKINCIPEDDAPKKPKSLMALEAKSMKLRRKKTSEEKMQKLHAFFQDGESRVLLKIRPLDVLEKTIDEAIADGISPAEISPVQSFLSGKNCLNGGNGWWKYEFCYGRSVTQYHIEQQGRKNTIYLGRFDKKKHLEWFGKNPRKKLDEQRKYLSHFYSDGDYCAEVGKRRQTEVRLKCTENLTTSPSSVSLFLIELKTCEYVLRVESSWLCNIVSYADENDLIPEQLLFSVDKIQTESSKGNEDIDERIASGDE